VLTRRLSLRLLAPTVLVSLVLVVTCVVGLLYLNRIHLNVSLIHTEHVESTLAAADLEAKTVALIQLLRSNHRHLKSLQHDLEESYDGLNQALGGCRRLANLDREKELVGKIADGVKAYGKRWEERSSIDGSVLLKEHDAQMAVILEEGVLKPCRELRQYNTERVAESDRENTLTVNRLTWLLLLSAFGAPLGGLWLGYTVARGLYRSLYQLSVRIRDAAGRLAGEVKPVVVLKDTQDLHDLHDQLQGVIEEIERVVSRLQQREREMLRTEQLAAVGQVAAGVAHELRNPLTSVKMLVQTGLEGPSPEGLPPEDLAIIEQEVRRMELCIQAFLDYGRPPAAHRRRADLVEVVHRALALVEGRARRQKVELHVKLPPGPVELLIDPDQIHQVIVNLLLNALDVLPHGGTIQVRVLMPSADAPYATVDVQDSGPGLPPHLRDRIFEPFVSGKETGLGLGLSICRRLVEDHGGKIVGDNAAGGGAIFRFTLPASTQ
jgi:signal transduction histidine kinase